MDQNTHYELATFGGGCFWCTEAMFLELDGVIKVESGYSGGHVENPTYKQVCTATTGHAEVRSIIFYHSPEQKKSAEYAVSTVAPSIWGDKPITTQIEPLVIFYPAEGYHQNYLDLNPNQPYCVYVVNPKVEKFRKVFKSKLKKHE